MKQIYGICESIILVVLGLALIWFALSPNYGLLMNIKFKWLTITGAASMLVMGLLSMSGSLRRSGLNTIIFGLMLLVVLAGKPYLPGNNIIIQPETSFQKGLWSKVDQLRFPRKDLQVLCTSEAEEIYRSGSSFTTVGMAKRLNGLDSHGSFALMTTMMYCCLADMFATGLRVPYENWKSIKDGQWFMVSGKLVKEKVEITLPNFRFGRAMLASVKKDYYLKPEKIMSYDRVDQLPLLTDMLSGEKKKLFSKAVKESGLWRDLEKDGPFTIFLPVDRAIENMLEGLGESTFEDLSQSELKQFAATHIVNGKFSIKDILKEEFLEALNGQILKAGLVNGKVKINQSRLLFKDSGARNGIIHFIYPAFLPHEWGKMSRMCKDGKKNKAAH